MVAHEPPLFELLPDRDHWRAVMRDVEDAFAAKGAGPAPEILNAALQMSGRRAGRRAASARAAEPAQGEPDPETLQMMARMGQNIEFFIGYEVPPFARYTPDIAALRASPVRVMMAVGEASAR